MTIFYNTDQLIQIRHEVGEQWSKYVAERDWTNAHRYAKDYDMLTDVIVHRQATEAALAEIETQGHSSSNPEAAETSKTSLPTL